MTDDDTTINHDGTLHIYAQFHEHDPAFIVGDRKALTWLRDVIITALERKCGQDDFITNDGEGYDLVVVLREDMASMGLSYVESSRVINRDGKSPYDLVRFDRGPGIWTVRA